jgi:putative ABC transport system substrate-binding protein
MAACNITKCSDAVRGPAVERPNGQKATPDATTDAVTSRVLFASHERGMIEAAQIPVGVSESCDDRARSCIQERRRWRKARSRLRVASILACWLAASLPAQAQETKPIQIGVLALGPRSMPVWHCGPQQHELASAERRRETMPFYVLGLLDELKKLNYVEDRPENAGKQGRRFALDLRMGTLPEVRSYAREFARKRVDIIVAVATATARVVQEETRDDPIPTLLVGVSDPVGEKFVPSLARPGGFITGVSHQSVQGSGKRVELFKEILPGLRRMITIRTPGYTPSEKALVEIRAAAGLLNIDVLDWTATSRAELQDLLAKKVQRETADGIMITPDSLIISNLDLVIETSLEQRVPAFGLQDFMADWGALAAYGPSAYQAGGRTAWYFDKISKGAKPGDLPIEPVDPTFVVNLKAAACLGVSVPLEVLHEADRIIR